MNTPRILSLALASGLLLAAPAFAQEAPATLRVDIGSAMVSTGGEFSTAHSGTTLPAGSRVMLTEGSQATLVYPNGCTQPLRAAGVHSVPATCVAAAAGAGSTFASTGAGAGAADLGAIGIISGVAVGAAAVMESQDDKPYVEPPPVSR